MNTIYLNAIIAYLIVILMVGLACSRNVNSVSVYAIADKKFGTFILLMTFLATSFGAGSTVGDTAKIMRDGLVFPLSMSGFFVFCYYMSKYVAPRFDSRFAGMISAGDIIEYFYGKKPSYIASFIGFLAGSLTVGSQITGLCYLLQNIVQIDYQFAVLAVGLVTTIYSASGGIRAVTITDTIQALIMVIVIPIFAFIIISKAGGVQTIMANTGSDFYQIFNTNNAKKYLLYFIVSFLPFLWLFPPIIQRFLMTTESEQISKMYRLEFIVRIVLYILLALVAASAITLHYGHSPDSAISHLIINHLPSGIGVLLVIAILSASMSTADSHLNSSAILLVHNVCSNFVSKEKSKLLLLRAATLALGIGATLIAMQQIEIVSLVIFSFALSGAVIGIPLFFGVMGFKVTTHNFYGCLLFAIAAIFISLYWMKLNWINAASITIFAGLIGFFGSRFCKPKVNLS